MWNNITKCQNHNLIAYYVIEEDYNNRRQDFKSKSLLCNLCILGNHIKNTIAIICYVHKKQINISDVKKKIMRSVITDDQLKFSPICCNKCWARDMPKQCLAVPYDDVTYSGWRRI